jgi:hypothetical protein
LEMLYMLKAPSIPAPTPLRLGTTGRYDRNGSLIETTPRDGLILFWRFSTFCWVISVKT